MHWYQYLSAFFAGAFLANTVPHFVSGISGNRFPTPFASPSGKGLSSPLVNVTWALFNMLVGYFLFRAGHIGDNDYTLILFFLGIAAISIPLSIHFQQKDKE